MLKDKFKIGDTGYIVKDYGEYIQGTVIKKGHDSEDRWGDTNYWVVLDANKSFKSYNVYTQTEIRDEILLDLASLKSKIKDRYSEIEVLNLKIEKLELNIKEKTMLKEIGKISKREFIERVMKGEVLIDKDGDKFYYDETKKDSPFRYFNTDLIKDESLFGLWDSIEKLKFRVEIKQ